jgi:riboflavin kinase / FMN adenylyltransferase
MRLVRHHTEVPVEARGAVVALGNFDGVHRGHQAVIGEAARLARELGVPYGVVTFEPHPRQFFQPDQSPFTLTPLRIKLRTLEAIGVDYVYLLTFNRGLAEKSAEAFVTEILGEGLAPAHVVVGYDFLFGKGRRGNAALLADLGRLQGFAVTSVEAAKEPGGEVFSSTAVREHLKAGRPDLAARLLGRPFEISGHVRHGEKRGRELGFPTANILPGPYLEPAYGVYAVKAGIDLGIGTAWEDGVASFGLRPTVGGDHVLLEAHLFQTRRDLYGCILRVAFLEFLRPEHKFRSLEALAKQMRSDCKWAKRRIRSYAGPPPGALPPPLKLPEAHFRRPDIYERALRPRQPGTP